jgi:hypothetical protein
MHDTISPGKKVAFGVLVAYSLAWKAASLWRAAKDDSKPWFATLFLVNSAGILDALYIFKISPARKKRELPEIIDGRPYIQRAHPEET